MLRSSTDLRVRERHGARVTDHERAGGREPGASSALAATARARCGVACSHAGPDQNSSGRCSRPLPTTLMRSGLPGRQSVRSHTPPIEKYTIRLLLLRACSVSRISTKNQSSSSKIIQIREGSRPGIIPWEPNVPLGGYCAMLHCSE